jgi:hypothetical protein
VSHSAQSRSIIFGPRQLWFGSVEVGGGDGEIEGIWVGTLASQCLSREAAAWPGLGDVA